MQICLGTANFSKNYGLKRYKVQKNEIKKILNFFKKNRLKFIDTANKYRNSNLLKNEKNFKIITKLDSFKNIQPEKIEKNILKQIIQFKRGRNNLYGVLVHDCSEMNSKNSKIIYNNLVNLKKKGLTKKIGISCYYEKDLDLLKNFDFDIIQFPLNIFDQRLKKNKNLKKIVGKEIYIRSIFLQGLILNKKFQKKSYFKKWKSLFKNFDNYINEKKISNLEASFEFLKQNKFIDKAIIGIDNLIQLKEIMKIKNKKIIKKLNFDRFRSSDENLILPINWKV